MAPRDEDAVDKIFSGCLENLPPLSSKVTIWYLFGVDQKYSNIAPLVVGCQNFYQLHLHGHVDGEEHLDGVGLPQDQGVLQGEARAGVPGGGHEVGGQGRDDQRAHDHRPLHERAQGLSEVQHGTKLHLLWSSEVRIPAHSVRDRHR